MTEQMRMKPVYTGADLQILKDHLHRVRCKRTLRIPKLTEHISGSNTGALVILLQCADQKVRDQHKPAFVFLRIDDVQDVAIDINIDAYLPESYIRNHNQRIDIYKKIAAIETEDDKFEIEDELIDRFGDIPRAVQNIIEVASLKTYAKECGIYEIAQSGDNLLMKFGENYVDANLIMGLDKMFPKRIKLLSGDKPVISYAIKGEYKKILNIVNNLLSTIKELQSAEKDSIIKS